MRAFGGLKKLKNDWAGPSLVTACAPHDQQFCAFGNEQPGGGARTAQGGANEGARGSQGGGTEEPRRGQGRGQRGAHACRPSQGGAYENVRKPHAGLAIPGRIGPKRAQNALGSDMVL